MTEVKRTSVENSAGCGSEMRTRSDHRDPRTHGRHDRQQHNKYQREYHQIEPPVKQQHSFFPVKRIP